MSDTLREKFDKLRAHFRILDATEREQRLIIARQSEALNVLEAENAKLKDQLRWRKVEEELPEDGCTVEVWLGDRDCHRRQYGGITGPGKSSGNRSWWIQCGTGSPLFVVSPTHWRPVGLGPEENGAMTDE